LNGIDGSGNDNQVGMGLFIRASSSRVRISEFKEGPLAEGPGMGFLGADHGEATGSQGDSSSKVVWLEYSSYGY
jgi:hypothetical protein